jgi:mono/diheme cytochrome c family protein
MQRTLVITLGLFTAALATLAQNTGNAGNPGTGRQLFMREGCYWCHGTVGEGGITGARIGALSLSARSFILYVRRPAGAMPAFTDKVLSDQQLSDIYAYLKSLPVARSSKDIPLLNDLRDK